MNAMNNQPVTIEATASYLRGLSPENFPSTVKFLNATWRYTGYVGTYNGPVEYVAYAEVLPTPDPLARVRLLHLWLE